MASLVCEVCYSTCSEQYSAICDEDNSIMDLLSIHLPFVIMDGVEQPQICLACWKMIQHFHQFYQSIEELHRPQSESSGGFEDEDEQATITAQDNAQEYEAFKCESFDSTNDDKDDNSGYDDDTMNSYRQSTSHVYIDFETYERSGDITLPAAALKHGCPNRKLFGNNISKAQNDDNYQTGDYKVDGNDINQQIDDTRKTKCSKIDRELIDFYGPLVCEICKTNQTGKSSVHIEYDQFSALKSHLLAVHEIKKASLTCPICSKTINLCSKLLQHIALHRNPDAFRCSVCNEVFEDLENHKKINHQEQRFECKECGKRFSVKMRWMTHMKISHAPKNVLCKICNKSFSKYCIKEHIRTAHSENEFICEYCGKAYRRKAPWKQHKMQHEGVLEIETTRCSICSQQIRTSYLTRHIERMHSHCNTEVCVICGKTFSSKQLLRIHQRRTCPKSSYSCAQCCKSFKTAAKLAEHETTHTEHGFYVCLSCLERFDSKSKLLTHQQKMHDS